MVDAHDRQRLVAAFDFALEAHGDQTRKGIDVPYSSHLLQVAGLVLEHGGDVDQAIAALLHDAVEDTHVSSEAIAARFGPDVAGMVRDCTDTLPGEHPERKRPWLERKRDYLKHLESAPERSLLVTVCDKLHNLNATLMDVRHQGPTFLERFNAAPDQQVWYFEQVLDIAGARVPTRLRLEMETLLDRFRSAIDAP